MMTFRRINPRKTAPLKTHSNYAVTQEKGKPPLQRNNASGGNSLFQNLSVETYKCVSGKTSTHENLKLPFIEKGSFVAGVFSYTFSCSEEIFFDKKLVADISSKIKNDGRCVLIGLVWSDCEEDEAQTSDVLIEHHPVHTNGIYPPAPYATPDSNEKNNLRDIVGLACEHFASCGYSISTRQIEQDGMLFPTVEDDEEYQDIVELTKKTRLGKNQKGKLASAQDEFSFLMLSFSHRVVAERKDEAQAAINKFLITLNKMEERRIPGCSTPTGIYLI